MRRGRSGSFELGGSEVESDENGRSWSGGETEGQDSEVLLSGWQRGKSWSALSALVMLRIIFSS